MRKIKNKLTDLIELNYNTINRLIDTSFDTTKYLVQKLDKNLEKPISKMTLSGIAELYKINKNIYDKTINKIYR
mgnify:CR=1 FL=1